MPAHDRASAIALDEFAIRAKKADKRRRYVVHQVPMLRLLGFIILWCVLAVGRLGLDGSWQSLVLTGLGFLLYCAVSWLTLLALPDSRSAAGGLVFLAIDPFVWMVAVYQTGGESSWLYMLALVRVADQLNTSRRQALAFAAAGLMAYVTLLAYIALADGHPVDWNNQVGRILFLAGCGAYLAMTAGTAERLREQLASAVRTARESIRQLQMQSKELREARERAESASHAKTQFLAGISHEFRTPLNAIIGYAELLHEEMPGDSPRVHEDIEHINRSARHLRGLINDVIELSRLEVGKVSLSVHRFSVASVIDEATSTVLPLVRGNENTLEVTGAEEAGLLVADAGKVRQILINLIGNASKFTTRGHVTVTCSRVGAGATEEVVFAVSDTGIGMTGEQLARIRQFEPFVQADVGIARRFGGTGLGLTISHRFARLMGGSLDIQSEAGRGSTITCRLPATLPEELWLDEVVLA